MISRQALRSSTPTDAAVRRIGWIVMACSLCALSCQVETSEPTRSGGAVEAKSVPTETSDEIRVLGVLPEFTLTDQNGDAFGLNELRGKVWIGTFIFTRCPATCPQQTAKMGNLQRSLSKHEAWEDIRLVSFSVDPEHDTPLVLRRYAERFSADPRHWKFLTGDRSVIWNLSKEGFYLLVKNAPLESTGPILHSQQLALVDRSGRLRGYYDALNPAEVGKLKRDLDRVVAETK